MKRYSLIASVACASLFALAACQEKKNEAEEQHQAVESDSSGHDSAPQEVSQPESNLEGQTPPQEEMPAPKEEAPVSQGDTSAPQGDAAPAGSEEATPPVASSEASSEEKSK